MNKSIGVKDIKTIYKSEFKDIALFGFVMGASRNSDKDMTEIIEDFKKCFNLKTETYQLKRDFERKTKQWIDAKKDDDGL